MLFLFCLVSTFAEQGTDRVVISAPAVASGEITFSFEAAPNELLTVQAAESLPPAWSDLAYHAGPGKVDFSAPAAGHARFFRVKSDPLKPLNLLPDGPVLSNGVVSLPDAVSGSPYSQSISPALSGVPPYVIMIAGQLPPGLELFATNNTVQVHASGTVTTGGRHQFSVSVTDARNSVVTRTYDLRVVSGDPVIMTTDLILKAGEPVAAELVVGGGEGPLVWSALDPLPEGVTLSPDGVLSGVPTADAAEYNETGRYEVQIEVADSFTDRLTGASAPRKTVATLQALVRLSYAHNIRAERPDGPSFQQACFTCHGPDFLPDLTGGAAELINVRSGSGAECGTERAYVTPGDASDSLIYEKLLARPPCGERMPFNGPYLGETQINRLARWIRELEPDDTD